PLNGNLGSTPANQDDQTERSYGLTPFCQILLPSQDGASMFPMLLMATDTSYFNANLVPLSRQSSRWGNGF
ncbi:hypothetical protein IFM89_037102, partial [Coptis chinensis]